jgi:hypothetical protein
MDKKREVINMPCKDILMCLTCKDTLVSKWGNTNHLCPKCRQPISTFERFYT